MVSYETIDKLSKGGIVSLNVKKKKKEQNICLEQPW